MKAKIRNKITEVTHVTSKGKEYTKLVYKGNEFSTLDEIEAYIQHKKLNKLMYRLYKIDFFRNINTKSYYKYFYGSGYQKSNSIFSILVQHSVDNKRKDLLTRANTFVIYSAFRRGDSDICCMITIKGKFIHFELFESRDIEECKTVLKIPKSWLKLYKKDGFSVMVKKFIKENNSNKL